MADLPTSRHDLLSQSISLQASPEDALSQAEAIALSGDNYFQRVRKHALLRFEEYLIKDLIYSAIIGPGLVGLIALMNGDVTIATAVWALVGFVAVLVAAFVKHLVEAPPEIDSTLRAHLARRQSELLAERARNAKPELTGEIECLEVDLHSNTRDKDYDCFLTFSLTLRNNSAAATMLSRFSLEFYSKGRVLCFH